MSGWGSSEEGEVVVAVDEVRGVYLYYLVNVIFDLLTLCMNREKHKHCDVLPYFRPL